MIAWNKMNFVAFARRAGRHTSISLIWFLGRSLQNSIWYSYFSIIWLPPYGYVHCYLAISIVTVSNLCRSIAYRTLYDFLKWEPELWWFLFREMIKFWSIDDSKLISKRESYSLKAVLSWAARKLNISVIQLSVVRSENQLSSSTNYNCKF